MTAGGEAGIRNLLIALGLLALVAFLPRLLRRLRQTGLKWIDVRKLHDQLARDSGMLLIDVRGPEEFDGSLGHIADARNIPLSDLPTFLKDLESSRRHRVTLVCRTDKRSVQAAGLLDQAGFADVTVLRGGMEQWNHAGFEIVRKVDT